MSDSATNPSPSLDASTALASMPVPVPHLSVLLVEDDPLIREVNHDLLEDAGFIVDSAENGELGWQALRKKKYDLLVTDYELPQLNGLQLVGRLRSQGLKLPVIMATGSSELGEIADYPELRLTAILKKPVAFDDLVGTALSAVFVA